MKDNREVKQIRISFVCPKCELTLIPIKNYNGAMWLETAVNGFGKYINKELTERTVTQSLCSMCKTPMGIDAIQDLTITVRK